MNKSIIVEFKENWNNSRIWNEFEYLYNEFMRYLETHPELKG